MFGTVLKLVPVIAAPLVDVLVTRLRKCDQSTAADVVTTGGAYLQAYAEGDVARMKLLHATALARAKFRALDAAGKK